LKLVPFLIESLGVVSYPPSMALSGIVCEIQRLILVENREIFIPHMYLAFLQGVTPSEFREDVWC